MTRETHTVLSLVSFGPYTRINVCVKFNKVFSCERKGYGLCSCVPMSLMS